MHKSFSAVAVCVLALSFAACATREKIGAAAAATAPANGFGSITRFDPRFALTPEFSLTLGVTQAVGAVSGSLPRRRLDVGVNYNLLQSLRRAGLF